MWHRSAATLRPLLIDVNQSRHNGRVREATHDFEHAVFGHAVFGHGRAVSGRAVERFQAYAATLHG